MAEKVTNRRVLVLTRPNLPLWFQRTTSSQTGRRSCSRSYRSTRSWLERRTTATAGTKSWRTCCAKTSRWPPTSYLLPPTTLPTHKKPSLSPGVGFFLRAECVEGPNSFRVHKLCTYTMALSYGPCRTAQQEMFVNQFVNSDS